MKIRLAIAALLLCVCAIALTVSATPDISNYLEYFNSSGQQIGWRLWGCFGTTGSGSWSDIYTAVPTSCETSEAVACSELELEPTACEVCMSAEYKALFDQNIAPDPCN